MCNIFTAFFLAFFLNRNEKDAARYHDHWQGAGAERSESERERGESLIGESVNQRIGDRRIEVERCAVRLGETRPYLTDSALSINLANAKRR